MSDFETKDSGKREEFESGMVRDLQEGKPRFDLILPKNVPYSEQMLTRWANLMERGRAKYGERNWEQAEGLEELDRAKTSAFRHFMQWYLSEEDEDHAVAVFFNITEAEYVKRRLKGPENAPKNLEPITCNVQVPHKCKEHPTGYWPKSNAYDC